MCTLARGRLFILVFFTLTWFFLFYFFHFLGVCVAGGGGGWWGVAMVLGFELRALHLVGKCYTT
jgi:hypothetical protein